MLRHCDDQTMEHIIELRKKLAEAEKQRENALDACMTLKKEVDVLKLRLEKYGDFTHDEDRNC